MKSHPKKISGTAEWAAVTNANFCTGCSHECRYCFARYNAVQRFRTLPSNAAWGTETVRWKDVNKPRKLEKGIVMLPVTHDITPAILDPFCIVLRKLLAVGNSVLIVSKPHFECIVRICCQFQDYKDKILFRFTIGSVNNDILGFWEPHAPKFEERKASLKYAFECEYKTSVSCEPLLDPANATKLYDELVPFITDSIWFGKLNKPDKRIDMTVPGMQERLDAILTWQTDAKVKEVYARFKDKPKVKWKESYKEVLGLPLATEAGKI